MRGCIPGLLLRLIHRREQCLHMFREGAVLLRLDIEGLESFGEERLRVSCLSLHIGKFALYARLVPLRLPRSTHASSAGTHGRGTQ